MVDMTLPGVGSTVLAGDLATLLTGNIPAVFSGDRGALLAGHILAVLSGDQLTLQVVDGLALLPGTGTFPATVTIISMITVYLWI